MAAPSTAPTGDRAHGLGRAGSRARAALRGARRRPRRRTTPSSPTNYAELRERRVFSAGVPAELGRRRRVPPRALRDAAHARALTAARPRWRSRCTRTSWPHRAWRWRHDGAPVEPFLRRVAAEELILVTSGGSDFLAGSGVAEKVDGGYRITARKVFGSGSPARTRLHDDGDLRRSATTGPTVLHFPVPLDAPGVEIADNWRTLGMRGTGSNDIVLEGVFVPDAAIGAPPAARALGPAVLRRDLHDRLAAHLLRLRRRRRGRPRARAARGGAAGATTRRVQALVGRDGERAGHGADGAAPHDRRGRDRPHRRRDDQRGADRPHAGRPRGDPDGREGDGGRRAAPASTGPSASSGSSATSRAPATTRCCEKPQHSLHRALGSRPGRERSRAARSKRRDDMKTNLGWINATLGILVAILAVAPGRSGRRRHRCEREGRRHRVDDARRHRRPCGRWPSSRSRSSRRSTRSPDATRRCAPSSPPPPGASVDAAVAAATRTALLEARAGPAGGDRGRLSGRAEVAARRRARRPTASRSASRRRPPSWRRAPTTARSRPNTYRPHTTAGVYVPTVFPAVPHWGKRKPWVMTSGDQFRPGPPPSLTSDTWTRDYNEIKAIGGKTSTQRTPEQTAIAQVLGGDRSRPSTGRWRARSPPCPAAT